MEFHKDEVKNKVVWTKGADITDGSPRYTFEGRDPATTYERFQVVIYTERERRYAIQPKTIEELLTSYSDDYFQLMTPCGFVDLTPSETEKLLHGEATMAHPGVSGCQMPVEAQELLEMEVLSLKRDEHGCWYALTDHPQQKMEQAPQEPLML